MVGWPTGVSRTAAGRLRPQIRNPDVQAVAASQPHRRGIDPLLQTTGQAESPLGRLWLRGTISEILYIAGRVYREHVLAYRAVIGAPTEFISSIAGALEGHSGGGGSIPDRVAARRKLMFNDAYDALQAAVGLRGAQIVAHCVVGERDAENIEVLIKGLEALARHYNLNYNLVGKKT